MAEILGRNFVCVHVYCQTVDEESSPRSSRKYPQFTFRDKSVPLIVVFDPEAQELEHQMGMPKNGAETFLKGMIKSALKKHGPVAPPKEIAALRKDLEAAQRSFDKGNPREAGSRLRKLLGMKLVKEYPDPAAAPPAVAEARQLQARFEEAGAMALQEAQALEGTDPAAALKAFRKVAEDFETVAETAKAAREAVVRLQKAAPKN